ncbi:MAG TPA: adenosylcobinamide-GDP ribazoletransferase [Armatimonadota bacterium]|nr:adenosylcobinamide-GDP ribazoletransferase [Armatimonadota bacterium]
MRAFLAALGFLTVLPVPSDGKALKQSVPWFPVVGLLIGGLIASLDYALGHVFPPLVTSVLIVIALIGISGGLHLDGLADTADGFLSSPRSDRGVLEIMKDSRIGTMGTLAIVSVFAMKVACLSNVIGSRFEVILLMPVAGRCAMVLTMAVIPYARPEGGLGSAFEGNDRIAPLMALAVLFMASWLVLGGWMGMASAMLAVIIGLFMAIWSYLKIGGFTGDVLGAACEIAEIAPALVASALVHLW